MHLEGGFKRGGRISGEEFEANCSKQMGQHKKMIFHQMFLCLHERWWRFGRWMWIVIVLLQYKVEGGQTDTELRGCARNGTEADTWYFVLNSLQNIKYMLQIYVQSLKNRMDIVRFLSFADKPCCYILMMIKYWYCTGIVFHTTEQLHAWSSLLTSQKCSNLELDWIKKIS